MKQSRQSKQSIKDYNSIEEAFFELDHENKTAFVRMEYEKPGDILEEGMKTRMPRMSMSFFEMVISLFDYIPDKYKLNIQVAFDDPEGYTGEQLEQICRRNVEMELKTSRRVASRRNRLALLLCGTGLGFILLSILISNLWQDGSTAKDIVAFVLDIAATVPFWGAMEIFFIDSRERRKKITNIRKRFHGITFSRKDEENERDAGTTEENAQ